MTSTPSAFTIRRSEERGNVDHGWLKSKHTFSFAGYQDPAHMGFRTLRVINQDRVAPGGGFSTHPHQNMEIFSYVLEGELAHEDSMGNKRTLRPGEIQLMSAGSGVTHSEFNPSEEHPLHFLQIWILPNKNGLTPSYTEWKPEGEAASHTLLISPDGREGSATINQDACVYRVKLGAGESLTHQLESGHGLWLQIISGIMAVSDEILHPGDALSTEQNGVLGMKAVEDAEGLLFDLG